MTSTTLTPDMISKRTMAVLSEKAQFVGSINRDYEKEFGKTPKIGDSFRIRMPIDPIVVEGKVMPDTIPEYVDRNQRITIDSRFHIPMDFDMADLKLDIDEFTERFIDPSASKMAARIEQDIIRRATLATANYVGTPGVPLNDLAVPLDARAKLAQNLIPDGVAPNILLSTRQSTRMVKALAGLFNDQGKIGNQYSDGRMVRAAGFGWRESESITTHTNGTATNGTVTANVATNGATTIGMSGLGANGTIKAGSVFVIGTSANGVFAIHPETKAVFDGELQQFVVTADVTANSTGVAASVPIFPAIYFDPAAQWQNVSRAPAATNVVTWVGAPSSITQNALAYIKSAFSVAFVELPKPEGVHFASTVTHDGISLRVIRDYDPKHDRIISRMDVMYGFKAVRPEWACRIAG